ncbi:frizzled 10 [Echinococcus multilocularis]|uniref:Frizzled 10 n=1 Tax=Echinococcus multilocularis TaxID=6211 RepID=A0A087VY56_ECHMU|nr:frizzled 10 [Echinococcus multilocularis]
MSSTSVHGLLLLLLASLNIALGQNANLYTSSDTYGPVGQQRCFRPTRIEIPECKNLFYNFTAFPNLVGQETQLDARHQLQTFKPLITYKCSNHLAFFLCSVYAPMCDVNTNHLIGPCRPLCERVRKRCSPVLKIFNFDWPANLNCSRFPEKNTVGGVMCMKGPDIPEVFEEPSSSGTEESNVGKDGTASRDIIEEVRLSSMGQEAAGKRVEQSTEGLLRQLEELPDTMNALGSGGGGGRGSGGITRLGSHLQNWLARLHDSPLPIEFENEETPISLLISSLRYCSHLSKPTSYIFINRTGRCAPHCTADILFSPSAKTLSTVWTSVISGLCLLATTGTLLSFAIQPSLFHTLERPIIYIAGCQLAYALGFALRLKLGRKAVTCGKDPASGFAIRLQEGLDNSNCALVFLIQYYFFTAGTLWWTMMVIGWASRSTHHLRLARGRRDEGTLLKYGCCGWHLEGVTRHGAAIVEGDNFLDKQQRIGPSLRFAQLNRRGVNSSSAENNCLAKEHVVAWLTPGLLTVGVLVSRQVDADELLGICSVGRQNTRAMLIFVLIPQLLFLIVGLLAFAWCIIQLFKIRRSSKQRQLAPSATLTNLDAQSRYLVYHSDQQSEFNNTVVDSREIGMGERGRRSSCYCCCHSLRWDSFSTRLGFFSLLYIIPAVTVLACDFYEYLNRDKWLAGDPMSAISRIIKAASSTSFDLEGGQEITPELFLLRTFMSLVTGFATCLWILSVKGIEPWRYLGRQLGNRCAGRCCFSEALAKTPKLQQQQQQQSSASLQHSHPVSSKNTPSNTSTVLHPYAVYQHCCSTTKSSGDALERCPYTVRPPAGPGVDATDQFFVQQSAGLALASPNQASGYYSSATTTNNSVGSGSGVGPRPPPNTPPGTVNGDSNPGSSAHGVGWWEMNTNHLHHHHHKQQKSQPGGSSRHAVL